jgi:hypothetical protein
MANPLTTQRGFWTFAVLTWLLAMLCVVGVGLIVHAAASGFLFLAVLLTSATAFWLWFFRRLLR